MNDSKKNILNSSSANSLNNISLSSIHSPNFSKKKLLKRNSSKIEDKKTLELLEKKVNFKRNHSQIFSLNSSPNFSKRNTNNEFFLPKIPNSNSKSKSKLKKNNNSNIPIKNSPKIGPQLYRINYSSSFKNDKLKKISKKSPNRKKKKETSILPQKENINKNLNNNNNKVQNNSNEKNQKQNKEYKFISMASFNVAKMSWQKKNNEKGDLNNDETILNKKINNIREKKLKEKKDEKKEEKKEPIFTHFSGLRRKFIPEKRRYSINDNNKSHNNSSSFKKKNNKNSNIKLINNSVENLKKRKLNVPLSNTRNNFKPIPIKSQNRGNLTENQKHQILNNSISFNNPKNNISKINNLDESLLTNTNVINNTTNSTSNKIFLSENLKLQNINNVDIKSVTEKNLQLTQELQESLSNLVDNSHCVYCLKRVNKPITLICRHELCLECAKEIKSIYKFIHIKDLNKNIIKCPKCKKKTEIRNEDLTSLLRLNWKPREENSDEKNPLKKIQLCEICPSSKYIHDLAEFECLNCDIIICYECRIRHLSNPRHQDHKIIPYHKIVQEKIELTLCEENNHREPLKLFCETCQKPICLICSNYENDHKQHKIKTVKNILDEQAILLTGSMRQCEGEIKIMEELISSMIYSKEKFEEEKNNFIEKANNVFNDIFNIIKESQELLKEYIENLFKNKLETLNDKLTNFKLIRNRYDYYRNLICDRDIDIIDRVIQIKKLNKNILKIENLGLLHSDNFNKSFAQSLFSNNPTKEIKKQISSFKFLPITDITITILQKVFKKSKIINPELLFNDFIIILPKIKSGILLYQISKDGASPITFHEKCNNKGPTLTIIKTNDGHIFGGYNPISWINEAMYNECDDSFIFSLSDGMNIKPIKCPLKKYMKKYAIKQNENMYSPGWGEVDNADLFISYKNLENSYSSLGRCYKVPKDIDPNTFLAGKPNKWGIEEVEVFAIEVITEDDYYQMMLN